jgi:hypothetical protein
VPRRLGVAVAMLVFALCVLCGMAADNSFTETVARALKAMFGTLVVGLIVGAMAQKMLEENLKELARKSEVSEAKTPRRDR